MTESMHEIYMKRAIELAKNGLGHVNPNPLVGAVIVKDGRIIGEGWHTKYGALHAEREAFAHLTEDASGADMYVTLEPCCHRGKQPPCTEAIVEHGIRRVFIGSSDPNPLVSGKGISFLREHGIEVTEGICREACDILNPVFFKYISGKMPYVIYKYAMTLDGKTACHTGDAKWVSNEQSRNLVQDMRGECMAIMTGIGTVLADNPMLNARKPGMRQPIRIILDSDLRIPVSSRLVQTAEQYPLWVFTAESSGRDERKIDMLKKLGVRVLFAGTEEGHLSLSEVLEKIGAEGIDSILLEGGSTLAWSFIEQELIDEIRLFLAPKVFGGKDALTPLGGSGVDLAADAVRFTPVEMRQIEEDIYVRYLYVHGNH